MHADVAVVGGGSAGIAAAVAASRRGAHVVLIERAGQLGGQAAGALVHSICGLYLLRESAGHPLQPANPGFSMEFAGGLEKIGATRGPVRMGRLDVLLHEPAAFAFLADRICADSGGIEVILHAEVLQAVRSGRQIMLTVHSRGRGMEVEADAAVDATGDAELAALVGAEWTQEAAEKLQRPAHICKLTGVAAFAMTDAGRIQTARMLSAAVVDGLLPEAVLGTSFRAGIHEGGVWATTDLPAEDFDAFDPAKLTGIERAGREIAFQTVCFLQKNVPGFERAAVAALPARAGIRETRRIRGHYELSGGDVLAGARFSDEVALAAWPMELREKPTGPRWQFPVDNRPCGIPLRSLRSRNVECLFMAGRCVSCTHEAQASLRVIGTSLATGEAAGNAAAEFAAGSGVDISPARSHDPRP
jgi:hypothetical protein